MKTKSPSTIYTIGHSTHTAQEFLQMLQSFAIKHLVDVRHYPGSRKFPQFNKEQLQIFLPEHQISYTWLLDLGGRRKLDKESVNTKWRHPAFRSYADYMQTDEFKKGINKLLFIAEKEKTAIMCSEAVWWRCHRSMISDYVKFMGWEVLHIMNSKTIKPHPYTQPAGVFKKQLSYVAEAIPLRKPD